MSLPIVVSQEPVTLVGGADIRLVDLTTVLKRAPTLVAVDGGGDTVLEAGLTPVAVIGDMDSLSSAGQAALADRLTRIEEQVTTDFDKALRNIEAPFVLAIGFTGGRIDHELAVMQTLVRRADRPCLVVGGQSLVALCPPRIILDLPTGTAVSLFPMGPVRAGSTGLRWPTDGLDFAPAGPIGTSNEAVGAVTITPDAPLMLLILPRDCLDAAIRSLSVAKRWPAP